MIGEALIGEALTSFYIISMTKQMLTPAAKYEPSECKEECVCVCAR